MHLQVRQVCLWHVVANTNPMSVSSVLYVSKTSMSKAPIVDNTKSMTQTSTQNLCLRGMLCVCINLRVYQRPILLTLS